MVEITVFESEILAGVSKHGFAIGHVTSPFLVPFINGQPAVECKTLLDRFSCTGPYSLMREVLFHPRLGRESLSTEKSCFLHLNVFSQTVAAEMRWNEDASVANHGPAGCSCRRQGGLTISVATTSSSTVRYGTTSIGLSNPKANHQVYKPESPSR